jgi:hypothetical protein
MASSRRTPSASSISVRLAIMAAPRGSPPPPQADVRYTQGTFRRTGTRHGYRPIAHALNKTNLSPSSTPGMTRISPICYELLILTYVYATSDGGLDSGIKLAQWK